MVRVRPEFAGNRDRLRWNARYSARDDSSFAPHPLAVEALAQDLPDGPVLELAAGPSGSALLAAGSGRQVVVVDASDVALDRLESEAARRGLAGLITLAQADLVSWRPEPASYALVLCTGYWDGDTDLFEAAADAVLPGGAVRPGDDVLPGGAVRSRSGGVLAWDALTAAVRLRRASVPKGWCLAEGEPASLLPDGWRVVTQYEPADAEGSRRRLLAVRAGP